ncbi:MAG: hypothetical protein AAB481_00640 [Patescibacteria group bacterium]
MPRYSGELWVRQKTDNRKQIIEINPRAPQEAGFYYGGKKVIIMRPKDIYQGPDWSDVPISSTVPVGEYTAADQARGFGIPEEQLTQEDEAGYPCDTQTQPVE